MKAVMISIQPKWCELIASGEKTIEVRKTKPKLDRPFKCYIYCTQGKNQSETFFDTPFGWIKEKGHIGGKVELLNTRVIGEFVCDSVLDIPSYVGSYEDCKEYDISDDDLAKICLGQGDLFNYGRGKPLYGWHISDLKIYDKPKELGEFYSSKECESYYGGYSDCDDLCGVAENNQCRCGHTALTRPPQSYFYVEELK